MFSLLLKDLISDFYLVSPVQENNEMAASSIKRDRKGNTRQTKRKPFKKKQNVKNKSNERRVKSKGKGKTKKARKTKHTKDIYTL